MTKHETNPWGSSLDKLKEWDPKGAELLLRVGTSPWTSGVLPRKEVELISIALHSACTNLDETGTRRHIRAALDAGATRDEILLVLKCGVGLAVHSCSLGAPILLEEMKAAGVTPAGGSKPGSGSIMTAPETESEIPSAPALHLPLLLGRAGLQRVLKNSVSLKGTASAVPELLRSERGFSR